MNASPVPSEGLVMGHEGRSFHPLAEAPRWEWHVVLQKLRGDPCAGWEEAGAPHEVSGDIRAQTYPEPHRRGRALGFLLRGMRSIWGE